MEYNQREDLCCWFGLSYASFLVLPRVMMEAMPEEWQKKMAVPNPVTLRPYRTFMEVEQPASTFVLRMRSGRGNPPSCALFEADGRMWQLEAIKNIKGWLKDKIENITIIA